MSIMNGTKKWALILVFRQLFSKRHIVYIYICVCVYIRSRGHIYYQLSKVLEQTFIPVIG